MTKDSTNTTDSTHRTNFYAADQLVVNFHDACIYGRDLALLENPTAWLNDACLHFALQDLQQQQQQSSSSSDNDTTIYLDPAVVAFFMHQCHDDEDLHDFVQGSCRGLGPTVHRLVIPINDTLTAAEWAVPGLGSHWSCLLLEKQTHKATTSTTTTITALHFDSMASTSNNLAVAQAVTDKLVAASVGTAWHMTTPCRVHTASTPLQRNGYDCGVHVIAVAQAIAACAVNNSSSSSSDRTIPAYETKLAQIMKNESTCWEIRQALATRIRQLASQHKLSCH